MTAYFEEYRCGCLSPIVNSKKKLLGYCKQHGDDRRTLYRDGQATEAIRKTKETNDG